MSTEIQERTMSGRITTREEGGRLVYHKVVVVAAAGTRVQVPVGDSAIEVTLQAPIGNTNPVYVGDSGVTNAGGVKIGLSIRPGITHGPLRLERPGELWVDADTNGDELVVFGVK